MKPLVARDRRGRGGRGVPLNRALSKLRAMSRAQAAAAIRAGRVRVDGLLVVNPSAIVVPGASRIHVDGRRIASTPWRTIVFYKPRGVVTTSRDPEGRPTVYDVLGPAGRGLAVVGRLDLATSGLLLLTSDTALADRIADPAHQVPRVYTVTVRGTVTPQDVQRLIAGIVSGGMRIRASDAILRKASSRESHLVVELREGRNREVRRLFDAIGHEVMRLKRVQLGGLELGALQPGQWRELTYGEIEAAFPGLAAGPAAAARPPSTRRSRFPG